ncbi:MAG: hypothetical protein A2W80_09910 [Candidatus Riflebacteria bacterium GWC2_50_8]|nr:MAG: hypothetical protein A2W80_09910 [Candidatus Riflebacteria bacterium GWC2_50_8]
MKRVILVILLILGLCQGFCHEDPELLLCRVSDEDHGLKESVSSGEILNSPRPALRFNQLFAASRQQPLQIQSHKQKTLQTPTVARFSTARGYNRRIDDAILPDEWGLVILRFPRSDG